jgi:hypothetical protein
VPSAKEPDNWCYIYSLDESVCSKVLAPHRIECGSLSMGFK